MQMHLRRDRARTLLVRRAGRVQLQGLEIGIYVPQRLTEATCAASEILAVSDHENATRAALAWPECQSSNQQFVYEPRSQTVRKTHCCGRHRRHVLLARPSASGAAAAATRRDAFSIYTSSSHRCCVNLRNHTRAGGHIHTTGGHRGHTRRATCPRSHHAAGPADKRSGMRVRGWR